MPGGADSNEQAFEIRVAMLESSALQMQMIMAKLVFDDRFRLFGSEGFQLMRIDLDIVAFRKISAAGRAQPGIKSSLVQKRTVEVVQRHSFDPPLQLFVFHLRVSLPALPSASQSPFPAWPT